MNKSQMEQAFVMSSQLRLITQQERLKDKGTVDKLSMQAIVDTARFPLSSISEKRRLQINQNLDSRRLYSFILKRISEMQSLSQVAASSPSTSSILVNRKGDDFELKVVADPDHQTQGFLLVKLVSKTMINHDLSVDKTKDKANADGLFLHCESKDGVYFLHLHETSDLRFQTIISLDQPVYQALCHYDSQLYLSPAR